jgi:heme-degrading monooxygenase HmoA
MHVLLWRFRPRPGREEEFVAAYGGDGAWAQLFRTADGFLGTELMRGSDGVYLTIDRWSSESAWDAFRESHAARHAELDAATAALTLEEAFLGAVNA